MVNLQELPGLDVPAARLTDVRLLIAPYGHFVSYRRSGQPFLPEGKGYNRSDGALEVPDEFQRLAPYVMGHRSRGGRIEILYDGSVMCDRCGITFTTLVSGRPEPGHVVSCAEGEERDHEVVRRARSQSRAHDNLEQVLALAATLSTEPGTTSPGGDATEG